MNGTSMTALLSIPAKILNRLSSRAWSAAFKCTGLRLHHTAKIKGASGITIGKNFSSGRYLWLEAVQDFDGQTFRPHLNIGDNCNFSDMVHVACCYGVEIGDGVLVGSKVLITDHNHGCYSGAEHHSSPDVAPNARPLTGRPVIIGNNVFLGDGSVILPGTRIGDGAVIAANAVVSGTLAGATIYGGIPATAIKRFDEASQNWLGLK